MNDLEICRTPELIGAEIRTLTTQAQSITLWFGIEIGRKLTEAKELCAHGEWLYFLKKETTFSQPTANRFMRLFSEYGSEQGSLFGAESKYSMLNNLSVSNALRLLALPEDEREDFAVENDVEHLPTSKVDELVKARVAELEKEKHEQALALASAESRIGVLQGELESNADELKKARAEIAVLEARPVEVAVERDEQAIKDAADAARAEAEKTIKEREKELAAAQKALKKAQKEAEDLRKDMAQLDKADAPEETVDKLRAQYDSEIRAAEERATAAEKQLKLAAPGVADFSAAFKRAQTELQAMADALAKITDTETAAKLRRAANAVLDSFGPKFKEG